MYILYRMLTKVLVISTPMNSSTEPTHKTSCCSVTMSCTTLCPSMDCSMPGFPVLHHLLEFAQTHVHWVSHAIQPSHLLSPLFPLALNLSHHLYLFQWVGQRIWSFSFSNSPSNEYSGLFSFSIDWFDLLTVQETLQTLLQHYSSKVSILWHSAFLTVQLLHPCMITGKTKALTKWTFFRVMSLLFNILSKFATAFLPRSNCLLISWLQSPSAVILEPKKIKSVTISLLCLPRSDGTIR